MHNLMGDAMPAAAKTMVVKIGSSTVTEPGTGVNRPFIARLVHEAVELRSLGISSW